jgi:preprotein translocase SecE subunit
LAGIKTKSTLVGVFYVGSAILLAWVLSTAYATLFATLRINDTPLIGDRVTVTRLLGLATGVVVGVGTYVWPKTKNFVTACAEELDKVAWPDWGETKTSTLVVILFSVISAAILGVFDITFQILSNWVATHV